MFGLAAANLLLSTAEADAAYRLHAMSEPDFECFADRWIAEFGDTAAWYAAKRIEELTRWGDAEGARTWTRVLTIIADRAPTTWQGSTNRTAPHRDTSQLSGASSGRRIENKQFQ